MILDLLFPRRCVGCSKEGKWICQNCVTCLTKDAGLEEVGDGVFALYSLEERVVREALHTLKYNGVDEIAADIVAATQSWLSAEGLYEKFGREVVLVPVPTSKARQKMRAYNQAEVIAQALGEWLGWEVRTGTLEKVRSGTLVGKTAEERRAQAQGMFRIKGEIGGCKNVVIVDDVLTTGATLHACRELLGGVKGLVIARAHIN